MELEHPKPRGRPRMRRESTISLGVDEDEAFSSAEDAAAAAAAMGGLSGGAGKISAMNAIRSLRPWVSVDRMRRATTEC